MIGPLFEAVAEILVGCLEMTAESEGNNRAVGCFVVIFLALVITGLIFLVYYCG
jgi:hypothetical protein